MAFASLTWLTLAAGCRATVSGTWTGTLDSPNKIGVRFVLDEQAGRLGGRTYWEDPETREFEPEGELAGSQADGAASWKTEGDVEVSGRFDGNGFVGTLTFPAFRDQPARTVGLTLRR